MSDLTSTPTLSFTIHEMELVDSTNAEARRRAQQGDPHNVIWAKAQTAGRGRYDRSWNSPEGNLYVSLRLPAESDLAINPQLSFVTALAVHETLQENTTLPIVCKWPNDILINQKKVAGILLEYDHPSRSLIIGIGINVASFPEDAIYPATSLHHEGMTIAVQELLHALLPQFAAWYMRWRISGFSQIRRAWLKQAAGKDEAITARLKDETLTGVFTDLDDEGNLLLQTEQGITPITAGDIWLKE